MENLPGSFLIALTCASNSHKRADKSPKTCNVVHKSLGIDSDSLGQKRDSITRVAANFIHPYTNYRPVVVNQKYPFADSLRAIRVAF